MGDINRLKEILNKSKAVMDKTEETHGSTSQAPTANSYGEKEIPNLTEDYNKRNGSRTTQSVAPQGGNYRNLKTSKMPKEILAAMVAHPIEIPESPNHTFQLEDVADLVNVNESPVSQPTLKDSRPSPIPTKVNSDSIRKIVREEIEGVVRKVVEEYLDKALITEDIQIKIGNTVFSGNLKPLPKKRKTKKRI